MQKQKPPTVATTDLMRAFNFTPADLDANQNGYMTKEQRIKLRHPIKFSRFGVKVFLTLLFANLLLACMLWSGLGSLFWGGKTPLGQMPPLFLWLFPVVCLIALLTTIRMMRGTSRKTAQDLYKGSVSTIGGAIHLDVPDIEKGKNPKGWHLSWQSFYSLEVNGIKFSITYQQWLAFLDISQRSVFVYYAPNAMIILSIAV